MRPFSLHAPLALLRGGWYRDVRVLIGEDGCLEDVRHDSKPAAGDRRLSGRALLPAPANLHSHGFQRALAGRIQRHGPGADSFWSWRQLMYRFLAALTPEMIGAITAQAQMEMCEAGYGAVAEFHYLHHAPGGRAYADPAQTSQSIIGAAEDTGIGLTLLPVLYAAGGADGRAPAGAQLRFACDADGYGRLWAAAARSLKRGPDAYSTSSYSTSAYSTGDWNIGIAPHSLRAVPRPLLDEVVDAHPAGPVHIHIAEQMAEVDEIEHAWGARPVAWLLDHHDVDRRWCLVHATHINDEECHRLAATGAVAGLCPITEADLGDGVFPAAAFTAASGRLGVGTDSNIGITLAGELRLLEYSQRLTLGQRNVLARAEQATGRALFDAALSGGAAALGRNAGAIEPGRLADLLTLDTNAVGLHGLNGDELLDGWIFSALESPVAEVWSAGRQTVEAGRHVAREAITAGYRKALDELMAVA
ncbi:MAG: formimidoylglutamate deiminase [Gammaproteobacteria bacterium]|nr:formimidoylglutamate deiminase [Gammaproteobacteria bacterium]